MKKIEFEIGELIEARLKSIRANLFLPGMAGRYHIKIAYDALEEQKRFDEDIEYLNPDEAEKFREELISLIDKVADLDDDCQIFWDSIKSKEDIVKFENERKKLIHLFPKFRLCLSKYERLSRLNEKNVLQKAIQSVKNGSEKSEEAKKLESNLRLKLKDFIKLEQEISLDLNKIDELRERLCSYYKSLAIAIAESRNNLDSDVTESAILGLKTAAEFYDFRRGYSFPAYAQHWIKMMIDRGTKK